MINLKSILGLKKVAGVEINIISETEIKYHVVVVEIKKGKLSFETIESIVTNVEELKKILSPKIPVCLSITGKGIILKKYMNSEGENDIISQILPFGKPKEFTFSKCENENNESWVAIIRTEKVNSIIKTFTDIGLAILDVFIGPLIISELRFLFDKSLDKLSTSIYEIGFEENEIISINNFQHEPKSYQISDDKISNNSIIALSSAFNYLIKNNQHTETKIQDVIIAANDFKVSMYLSIYIKAGIGLLFFLLLINFMVFSNLNSQVSSLNMEISQNKALIIKEKKLNEELKNKKELLSQTGLDSPSHLAYYADFIASTRPKEIVFDEMFLNPTEVNQYKKELETERNIIRISGNSVNSININNWLNKLNRIDFVDNAELTDLKYSNNKKTTNFIIEIRIKV